MKTTSELIDELEQATEALRDRDPEEFGAFLECMNERSRVLIELRDTVASGATGAGPADVERLTSNYREGVLLNQKLLIARAALRVECERVTQNHQVVRSLRKLGPDSSGRLDVSG